MISRKRRGNKLEETSAFCCRLLDYATLSHLLPSANTATTALRSILVFLLSVWMWRKRSVYATSRGVRMEPNSTIESSNIDSKRGPSFSPLPRLFGSKGKIMFMYHTGCCTSTQRDYIGVAPADSWNWGKWGLKEYKWKGSFLGWLVGVVIPVQEIVVQPWLL